MKKSLYYIILPLFLTGLVSCQEEQLVSSDGGRFDITLVDKPTKTRVLPFDLSDELKAQFSLSIKDADGKRYFSGSMTDYSTGAPALRPDSYILQAEYGENPVLALDAPYYISEPTTAAIKADKVTSVELVCKVGNALASFAFSDPTVIADLMPDYTFVAQAGGQTVSCTADDGHNPYFKAGSTVDFYLTGTTTEGKTVNQKFASITSAQPRMNYKYTLTIGDVPEGSADLDITVDTSVEEVQINETIPQEWLPKAKVSADGFDANNSIDYRETTDAVTAAINYRALMPVEDVELTLDMGDPELQALNKTYNLASLSAEDRTALENAGIALPQLNTETGTVDLSGMTGRLLCLDGGTTADNRVSLRIYANKRWSDATEYTIHTLRPEFNIGVNENDFWSKEFSVRDFTVTAGNATTVTNGTKYQYSTDGVTWNDFTDGKKQKFATHPDIKSYKVRALYRGAVPSETADVLLETPTQLPNSSLDEWTDEIYKSSYYCFYPWKTKDENCHWDTNNLFTTRHRYNSSDISFSVNGFHAVSYVPGRTGNGFAAELRSTANGRGNTAALGTHTEYRYNKVAGELYTGTSEVYVKTGGGVFGDTDSNAKQDTYTRNKDAVFNVRPTALHFYYKYAPYNSDSWNAHIELLDGEKNIIIEDDIVNSNSTDDQWNEMTLTLPYNDNIEYVKCRYIYVIFSSTITPGDNMPYNNNIDNSITFYINNGTETKTHSPAYVGSVLTIDDISLIYDK